MEYETVQFPAEQVSSPDWKNGVGRNFRVKSGGGKLAHKTIGPRFKARRYGQTKVNPVPGVFTY